MEGGASSGREFKWARNEFLPRLYCPEASTRTSTLSYAFHGGWHVQNLYLLPVQSYPVVFIPISKTVFLLSFCLSSIHGRTFLSLLPFLPVTSSYFPFAFPRHISAITFCSLFLYFSFSVIALCFESQLGVQQNQSLFGLVLPLDLPPIF